MEVDVDAAERVHVAERLLDSARSDDDVCASHLGERRWHAYVCMSNRPKIPDLRYVAMARSAACVLRRTSSTGTTTRRGGDRSPSIRRTSSSQAVRATCARSTRTVVSENVGQTAIGMSSKPTTVTSSGTRIPSWCAALSAPNAITSLAQKIAVGGSGLPMIQRDPVISSGIRERAREGVSCATLPPPASTVCLKAASR